MLIGSPRLAWRDRPILFEPVPRFASELRNGKVGQPHSGKIRCAASGLGSQMSGFASAAGVRRHRIPRVHFAGQLKELPRNPRIGRDGHTIGRKSCAAFATPADDLSARALRLGEPTGGRSPEMNSCQCFPSVLAVVAVNAWARAIRWKTHLRISRVARFRPLEARVSECDWQRAVAICPKCRNFLRAADDGNFFSRDRKPYPQQGERHVGHARNPDNLWNVHCTVAATMREHHQPTK
jgi:hypothetical protein